MTVSVPYRGATFLNGITYTIHHGKMETVSVPYRGATFLNYIRGSLTENPESFRPLSGSYISQ